MGAGSGRPTEKQPDSSRPRGLSVRVVGPGGPVIHALPVGKTLVIGRAEEADIFIDDPGISRRHLQISNEAGELQVEDLGSANGTRVGERHLKSAERVRVWPGEIIDIGGATLVFQSGDPRPASVPKESEEKFEELLQKIAASQINVLLLGETGVGKGVTAARIHSLSARAKKPFLELNCAALSESLVESELFGYEKGAFTGAAQTKPGLLESAVGGTFFLDEIGELPLSTQAKLLQVIEQRKVLRVGAVKSVPIDVRFIAATNRDLATEVSAGRFRQDLLFRVDGISVTIVPLRERKDQILALAEKFATDVHGRRPTFSRAVRDWLQSYAWPGNIRELKNVIDRALLLSSGGEIAIEHFPTERSAKPAAVEPAVQLDDLERKHIIQVLAQCGGNQSRAAKVLGISRSTLVDRLDRYELTRPRKK